MGTYFVSLTPKYGLSPPTWGHLLIILLLWGGSAAGTLAQTKQWDKTIGGSFPDELHSLQQTQDGGYILGGYSRSGISGDKTEANRTICNDGRQCAITSDYWVVKLDATGQKEWDKTFGGSSTDELYSLQQTSDGGYILGGWSQSGISGDKTEDSRGESDYWVIKIDGRGNKIWDKTMGGLLRDELLSLQQTLDGGYILGGLSLSPISGDKTEVTDGVEDYWVVKLDGGGNKEWDKTISGFRMDVLFSLQQTSDSGYILGGYSDSPISGDKTEANEGPYDADYWVVKLDDTGQKEWDKTFGSSEWDIFYSLQQTSDGGYILGGISGADISGDKTETTRGGVDFWVVKIDCNGQKEWDKTIGGSESDDLRALKQTSDGGYILGGHSRSGISGDKTEPAKGGIDYWIVKINAAGQKQWDKTLGSEYDEELYSLQQTSDGGYILGGYANSGIYGSRFINANYWVVKISDPFTCNTSIQSFTLVNADTHKTIRPLQNGDVIDLADMPTQNLKIKALTTPANVGSVVFHLDGRRVAVENIYPYRYGGPGKLPLGVHTLTATPYCNTRARGAPGTALTLQFQVIHSAPSAAIPAARLAKQEPKSGVLQAYPNSFSEHTAITFSVAEPGPTTLEVYDLKGNLVEQLYRDQAEPGKTYTVYFQTQQRASGIYLARLTSPKQRQYLKLVLRR